MKRNLDDKEQKRMIIFTVQTLYEYMKEDPRFQINDIPEMDVKRIIKKWLFGKNDSDLQVYFGKACAMALKKAIDQAVEKNFDQEFY